MMRMTKPHYHKRMAVRLGLYLTIIISDKYLSIMAKIGYIIAISQYDRLEEDRKWMSLLGTFLMEHYFCFGDIFLRT